MLLTSLVLLLVTHLACKGQLAIAALSTSYQVCAGQTNAFTLDGSAPGTYGNVDTLAIPGKSPIISSVFSVELICSKKWGILDMNKT